MGPALALVSSSSLLPSRLRQDTSGLISLHCQCEVTNLGDKTRNCFPILCLSSSSSASSFPPVPVRRALRSSSSSHCPSCLFYSDSLRLLSSALQSTPGHNHPRQSHPPGNNNHLVLQSMVSGDHQHASRYFFPAISNPSYIEHVKTQLQLRLTSKL